MIRPIEIKIESLEQQGATTLRDGKLYHATISVRIRIDERRVHKYARKQLKETDLFNLIENRV
ncbi:MAG: hypothetical protein ACK5OS_02015 [Chryseotalea sp.]